jgi:myosin heavy subunit
VIAVSSEEIVMVGCHTDHYLLEKARLVSHSANERSFHIFYQLLSGGLETDLLNKFQLDDKSANYFYYLSFGDSEVDNIDDEAELNTTLAAFETLGFEPEEIEALLASLAGVLFLGNVDFVETDSDGTMAMDSSTPDLNSCASLLGVNPDRLDRAVTTKERTVRTETIISPLSKEQSTSFRDALAKAIYGAIFDWVMMKVNESMKVPVKNTMVPFIGILDIFGFEIFEENCFEQLCINYCNEKLQKHFVEQIIKKEEAMYKVRRCAGKVHTDSTEKQLLLRANSNLLSSLRSCFAHRFASLVVGGASDLHVIRDSR